MSDGDARTQGTWGQDAALVTASWIDSLVDAPVWIVNKAAGTNIPAPLHLGADVYAHQTKGEFQDADGNVLTVSQVEDRAAQGEAQGNVIDAAELTAQQIKEHPLDVFPTWAKVLFIVAAGAAIMVGGAYVIRSFK